MTKKMKKLLEKELELIKPAIKTQVSHKLQSNFHTKAGNKINKVISVNIKKIQFDLENSIIREDLVINDVKIKARVQTYSNTGKSKHSTISLKLDNDVHLTFLKSINQYKIMNSSHFKIVDLSQN